MSYEEFIDALSELYMDVEEVAEALGLEVDEVKAWEESDDDIPEEAVEFIKSEKEKDQPIKLKPKNKINFEQLKEKGKEIFLWSFSVFLLIWCIYHLLF